MKIKKVATFLLIGMLFLNQSIPAFAEMSPNVSQSVGIEVPITPQWTNTNDVKLDLYFVNGNLDSRPRHERPRIQDKKIRVEQLVKEISQS